MRLLVAGVDDQGRSCVVSDQQVSLDSDPSAQGFWFANLFETTSAPPPARPEGRADRLDVALEPGRVRWQLIDFHPGVNYPMHHTDTVDIDIVLTGSVELTLDDGIHVIEQGEAVVINGVDHAWTGGPEGCRLSVTFIGTPALG
jgi:quercetin dioxygenase-like cupin family protein